MIINTLTVAQQVHLNTIGVPMLPNATKLFPENALTGVNAADEPTLVQQVYNAHNNPAVLRDVTQN